MLITNGSWTQKKQQINKQTKQKQKNKLTIRVTSCIYFTNVCYAMVYNSNDIFLNKNHCDNILRWFVEFIYYKEGDFILWIRSLISIVYFLKEDVYCMEKWK